MIHAPKYRYCPDPDNCCWTYRPISIVCQVDGEDWPCGVKQSHHTDAHNARLARWVQQKIRGPR